MPSPFRCECTTLEHTSHNKPIGIGGKNAGRQRQGSVTAIHHYQIYTRTRNIAARA